MDLKSGLTITRIKVTDIPVQNLAADNKLTTLKFENKSGVLLHPNYCLAGVDYEDKNANKSDDTNNDEQNSQKDDIKQDEIVNAEEHCKLCRIICRNT